MKKYFFLLVAIASANIVLGQVEEAFSSMVKYRNMLSPDIAHPLVHLRN